MKISSLRLLQTVTCPPDMGSPGYQGTVMSIDSNVQENHTGVKFVWVTVRGPSGSKHVWPSNRLQA